MPNSNILKIWQNFLNLKIDKWNIDSYQSVTYDKKADLGVLV